MTEGREALFKDWAVKLEKLYQEDDGSDGVKAKWRELMEGAMVDFPHLSLTWMNPKCGCCSLDHPALLAFADPRGPGMFEVLYPTYRPTHIYYFEEGE